MAHSTLAPHRKLGNGISKFKIFFDTLCESGTLLIKGANSRDVLLAKTVDYSPLYIDTGTALIEGRPYLIISALII
jgi:hypothetical protein